MEITPCNRYLLIEPLPEQEENESGSSGILLPDEFKPIPAFTMAKVLAKSTSCSVDVNIGERVIYRGTISEEVSICGETYYLLLENYIICTASK